MLTSLKYQATKGKGEKREAAQLALETYKNKSPEEKAAFLNTFEGNGGIKGGLAWVAQFSKKQEQTAARAFTEHVNYFTRASILTLNGMSIKDFGTQQEALEVADQIIAENMVEHEAQHNLNPPKVSNVNPLLNKYFYVHDEGLKTSFTDSETKKLELQKEISKKAEVATICDSMNEPAASSGGGVAAKEENASHKDLQAKLTEIQSLLTTLQKKASEITSLKFDVKVKAQKKPSLQDTYASLDKGHTILKNFLESGYETFMEGKALKVDDAPEDIDKSVSALNGVKTTGEACLDATKRAIASAKGLLQQD